MSKHLDQHRVMIAGRAALAGALGRLPLPVVDELLAGAVRVTLLQRIAEARRVDASRAALELLADPGPDLLGLAADGATALALFRKVWRRVALVLNVAGSADDVAHTFAVATLFDHYCARHHVGGEVDEPAARALREAIGSAMADARRRTAGRGLRGAGATAKRLLSLPRAAKRLASGVLVPERLSPGEAARPRGAAARSRAALAGAVSAWTEELTRAFDERWSDRAAPGG